MHEAALYVISNAALDSLFVFSLGGVCVYLLILTAVENIQTQAKPKPPDECNKIRLKKCCFAKTCSSTASVSGLPAGVVEVLLGQKLNPDVLPTPCRQCV